MCDHLVLRNHHVAHFWLFETMKPNFDFVNKIKFNLNTIIKRSKFNSLLYLSSIFEKSACDKVNFLWSTFTWNKVV